MTSKVASSLLTNPFSIGIASILAAAASGVASAQPPPGDVNSTNVYQRIKDADDNGLTVTRVVQGRDNSGADILLDEQGEAAGGRGTDAARRPLFRRVNEAKLQGGTYPEFIELLDNYVVRATQAETTSDSEKREIDRFLDKALATRPMRLAFDYIREDLGEDLTADQFRRKVNRIWFELFPNHFGGRETPFCSGFEHVFVGEGQFRTGGNAPRRGEISGYHGWVQFFRQERAGLVNYLGHKYDIPAARRPANPGVITLRMTLDHDADGPGGRPAVELFKPKGGFFVGLSPECELAMGTVAAFELQEGMFRNDMRRVVIDGDTYDLVLHPEVKPNGQRGDRIRTFFPILVGLAQPSDDEVTPRGDGLVIIVRALPNPEGDDETGEWVELKNVSDAEVDLGGRELRDQQGGTRRLEGDLAAGETRRFDIPRDRHAMRLGNGGGRIRLFHDADQVDEARYGRAAGGQIFDFRR